MATTPRLVRSVTVHEPPLFGVLPAANRRPDAELDARASAGAAVLDLIRIGLHRDAAQQFVEQIALGPGSWDLLPPRTQAIFERNAPTWAEEQADPTWDVIDVAAVEAGDVPVRLSYGTDSPRALRLTARTLAAMLPRAEVAEFPGTGHIPHVTHPDMFSAVLLRHLAAVGPMADT